MTSAESLQIPFTLLTFYMGAVSSSPNEIPTPQLRTRFKVISKPSVTQAYLVYAKHLLSLKFMLLALTQELLLKSPSVAILPSWEE